MYPILFSEEMRGEYGYDFDSFLADANAFAAGDGAKGAGTVVDFSLQEALDFLREMQ